MEVEKLPGWISRFGTLVGMTKYLARHIVRFALLMLAVGLVVFALVSASPIDPVQANVGQAAYVNMSEAKRAQLASYWGGRCAVLGAVRPTGRARFCMATWERRSGSTRPCRR